MSANSPNRATLFASSALIFFCVACTQTEQPERLDGGFVDLAAFDFRGSGTVPLKGPWQMSWRPRLAPGKSSFADHSVPETASSSVLPVLLPAAWNGMQFGSTVLGAKGYATYHLRVRLGAHKDIGLKIGAMQTAYVLWANGARMASNGLAGTDAASTREERRPVLVRLPEADVVELVLLVSNFRADVGGPTEPILLGPMSLLGEEREQARLLEVFQITALVIMGLYYLAFFLVRREELAPFWFGSYCLLISCVVPLSGERLAFSVLPDLTWAASVRFSFLITIISAPLILTYLRSVLPRVSVIFYYFILASSALCLAIGLLWPPEVFLLALRPFQVIILVGCAYVTVLMFLAARDGVPGIWTFLLGWFIIFGGATNDILSSNSLIQSVPVFPFALLAFVFLQSSVMVRRHMQAFANSMEMTHRLEALVETRTAELSRSNQEVQKLAEFSRKVNQLPDLGRVLDEIIAYISSVFKIEGIWILLIDPKTNEVYTLKTSLWELPAADQAFLDGFRAPLTEGAVSFSFAVQSERMHLTRHIDTSRLSELDRGIVERLGLVSFLHVPLKVRGGVIGVASFTNRRAPLGLGKEAIRRLGAFCDQIAGAIYTANLLRESEEARDALWGEMELAKQIQTVLLPQSPTIPGYEILGFTEPADSVGGDYYDVINVGERHWVAIGDVAGHGVTAGLIMMMVQSAIRTKLTASPDAAPNEVLSIANRALYANLERVDPIKYMTITLLKVDHSRLSFSGNHQEILVRRSSGGRVESHATHGMWLGVLPDISGTLQVDRIDLQPGDTVLLYTDGITEATANDKSFYGARRLRSLFEKVGGGDLGRVAEEIRSSLTPYKRSDDVTFLLLRRFDPSK